MSIPQYPEHEKLHAIKDQSQACYDFIEFLGDRKKMRLCQVPLGQNNYQPVHASIRDLLAEFFEIDMVKIEDEKRAMLDALREMNA
jgi:hypothetical protein